MTLIPFDKYQDNRERGITLLLVVVILSALLSISIGIFNVVYGELRISGEVADSFIALYAADRGAERALYRHRIQGVAINEDNTSIESSDGCYNVVVFEDAAAEAECGAGITSCVRSTGQYRCGTNPARVVKRRFIAVY